MSDSHARFTLRPRLLSYKSTWPPIQPPGPTMIPMTFFVWLLASPRVVASLVVLTADPWAYCDSDGFFCLASCVARVTASLIILVVRGIKLSPLVVFVKVVVINRILRLFHVVAFWVRCVPAVVPPAVVFVVTVFIIFGEILRHRWLRIACFIVQRGLWERVCIGAIA